jgi:hypothetical protein
MAKRNIEAIVDELKEARDSVDVTITVTVHGQPYIWVPWSESLTDDEHNAVDSVIEGAIDEAYELISERLNEILDLDIDEDYDPDAEFEDEDEDEDDPPYSVEHWTQQRDRALAALREAEGHLANLESLANLGVTYPSPTSTQ